MGRGISIEGWGTCQEVSIASFLLYGASPTCIAIIVNELCGIVLTVAATIQI